MAPNFIVQCLVDFGDGFEFERLCNDIMHLHYREFEPAGGLHDSGVDGLRVLEAEEARVYFKQSKDRRQLLAFQYSLQEEWETKIKKTLRKLHDNQIQCDRFVLLTNQRINHTALIKLQAWASKEFGIPVDVHDQEFLRVYLEDPHYEHLVHKYFASYIEQLRKFGIETSLFANLPLAERHKRRALVLLSACVRSLEGQEVKETAVAEVIVGCIYGDGKKVTRSRDDILNELQATFGRQCRLPDDLINQTLDDLCRSERIRLVENGFHLADVEWERIEGKIARGYDEDSVFYDTLVDEVRQDYELIPNQERDVKFAVAQGIGRIFEQKGLEIANALSGSSTPINLTDYPEISVLAAGAVSQLRPDELRRASERVIRRLFTKPTLFEAEYLFGVAESFLVYESFNLDPHGRLLEVEDARRNNLFVDTDIIVQVLVGELKFGQLYRAMLKATRNLNITMYTLPQMVHESVYKVRRSNEDYIYMGRPPRLPKNILGDLGDVFETYFATIAHTGQTWDQFVGSLVGTSQDAREQEAFVERRLEKEYGIQVRDFLVEIPIEQKEVSFARQIAEAREHLGVYKHDDLYETDATVALLIENLQQREGENGKRYWLLSSDSVLPKIWQQRIERRAPVFPPQSWFQYVSQYPTSETTPGDFATLMMSLTVSPARPQVPRNLLLTLVRFGVDISKYSTEALQELNERLYREWIWREVINKRPSEIADEQVVELGRSLNQVLERIEDAVSPDRSELSKRIKHDGDLIAELASAKRELEKKLKWYEEKEKRRKHYQHQMNKQKPKRRKSKRRF